MKAHEWFDRDEEAGERRYYRALKFSKRWTILTTLKSAPDWDSLPEPFPREVMEALREVLHNKYQRRRVPWEDIVAVDKLVEEAGGERLYTEKP